MKRKPLGITISILASIAIVYAASVPFALSGWTVLSPAFQQLAQIIYMPFRTEGRSDSWLPEQYFKFWCRQFARCEIVTDDGYISYQVKTYRQAPVSLEISD